MISPRPSPCRQTTGTAGCNPIAPTAAARCESNKRSAAACARSKRSGGIDGRPNRRVQSVPIDIKAFAEVASRGCLSGHAAASLESICWRVTQVLAIRLGVCQKEGDWVIGIVVASSPDEYCCQRNHIQSAPETHGSGSQRLSFIASSRWLLLTHSSSWPVQRCRAPRTTRC